MLNGGQLRVHTWSYGMWLAVITWTTLHVYSVIRRMTHPTSCPSPHIWCDTTWELMGGFIQLALNHRLMSPTPVPACSGETEEDGRKDMKQKTFQKLLALTSQHTVDVALIFADEEREGNEDPEKG